MKRCDEMFKPSLLPFFAIVNASSLQQINYNLALNTSSLHRIISMLALKVLGIAHHFQSCLLSRNALKKQASDEAIIYFGISTLFPNSGATPGCLEYP
jgi:hypothetical protein